MKAKPLPSQAVLNEIFVYSIVTGQLWRRNSGKIAGWFQKSNGYRMVGVERRHNKFLVHRIIWKMVTGEDAPFIDHENLDKQWNAWINLRDCSKTQNQGNRPVRSDNALGHKGVHWDENRQKYVAQIAMGGRRWQARFDSLEAAKAAHSAKAAEWYGEFARAA